MDKAGPTRSPAHKANPRIPNVNIITLSLILREVLSPIIFLIMTRPRAIGNIANTNVSTADDVDVAPIKAMSI